MVLAVVMVLVGAVMLRWAPNGGDAAWATTLQRVATVADQQCEQALLLSSVQGLRIDQDGFQRWQWQDAAWQPVVGSGGQWPPGAAPQLLVEGHHAALDSPARQGAPQILCDPVGTRSAFELSVGPSNQRWRLRINGAGDVEVFEP